jgi:long-chain acyl-CoA synthetase
MVVGEGKKHPSALIVPAFDAIKTWLKETENIEGLSNQQIIEHKKVIAAIDEEVLKYNKFFGQVEQLKRVVLLPQEWTVDKGELTPTLKLKRKIIHQKYESVIHKIYGE